MDSLLVVAILLRVLARGRLATGVVRRVVHLRLVVIALRLRRLHHKVRLSLLRVERKWHRRLLVELGRTRRGLTLRTALGALHEAHVLADRRARQHRLALLHALACWNEIGRARKRSGRLIQVGAGVTEELRVLLRVCLRLGRLRLLKTLILR